MIKLRQIKIEQVEGRIDRMVHATFQSFAEANAALRGISDQCSKGYLKTEVEITWDDGTSHSLRCDIDRDATDTNLTKVLTDWASRNRPGSVERNIKWMLPAEHVMEWEDHAERLLRSELAIAD